MIHMTPGVQLEQGTDNLGQRYLTPEVVLGERTSGMCVGLSIPKTRSALDRTGMRRTDMRS